MDTNNFIETVSKSNIPFVYYGEKMNDEKCQQALKIINVEGNILAMVLGNGSITEGLIITEKGIWFSFVNSKVNSFFPKPKGVFLYDEFILSNVTVKRTFTSNYEVVFGLWDLKKSKSFEFEFVLTVDYSEEENKTTDELIGIFKSLTSTIGIDNVSPYDEKSESSSENDPNVFNFVWGNLWTNIHTIITLKEDSINIIKLKFNDKTKIQTPIGSPVTISRSAIASVKKGRGFSPLSVLGGLLIGALIGFILIGGIITVILFTFISFLLAFQKLLIIKRKDGTKYKIRFQGNDKDNENYDRFINAIF
jgi:hypothetical protein